MNFLSMGKVVLRSLFGKPATYAYPFEPRKYPEALRGEIKINVDDCIFCGICSRKCPSDALEVDRGAKSWTINRMQCIYCCVCVDTCPKKCLDYERTHVTPDTVKQIVSFTQVPEEEPAAGESAPAETPAEEPVTVTEAEAVPEEAASAPDAEAADAEASSEESPADA